MQFEDFNDFTPSRILYYDVLSSHARSCQMLIKFLKIDVDLQLTDSMDDVNFNAAYTWLNAFCRLPTLVDGTITLSNVHSILIYLCEKYASTTMPNLCPRDYITRQKLTSLLYYEGSILNRCLSNLLTDIILAKYPNFDMEYHRRKVANAYNSLNAFLNGHAFMIGNRLTIADILIVSTVSALNIIFPINHEKFPKLFDWFQSLKQMEFYKYNDEGIQKLRYILKNVGNFNCPSPFNYDQDSIEFSYKKVNAETNKNTAQIKRYGESSYSNKKRESEKPTTSTRKELKNVSENEQTMMKEQQGYAEHKTNGLKKDSEKFKFYDTYFINVSKCNCSDVAEPNQNFRKHSVTCSENNMRKLKCRYHQLHSAGKTCCCNKESVNKEIEVLEAQPKKTERSSRKNFKVPKNNVQSCTSTDDTDDEISEKDQEIKSKLNTKISCSKKQIKKQDRAKLKEENHIQDVKRVKAAGNQKETLKDSRKPSKKIDSADENVHKTNLEYQELLEKVRKYEKILENTHKVLKTNNTVPTKTSSDTSSIVSVGKDQKEEKSFPLPSEDPNRAYQQTHKRRSSRVEALEFNEAIPIVLPRFLVAKSENEVAGGNSNTQIETGKRLEAGTNLIPFESHCSLIDVPGPSEKLIFSNEDSDNNLSRSSEKLFKVVYLYGKKYGYKSTNTCCQDCSGKKNKLRSKIPRLVSYRSLVNDRLYEISHVLGKEYDCSCQK